MMGGNKRILVTGSTGFVGRNLVPVLLNDGFDLVLPVRDATRCPPHFRDHPRIRVVEAKALERGELMDETLSGTFAVVHLAGLARVDDSEGSEPFEKANARMTEYLAMSVRRVGGVSVFIHVSSLQAVTDNASNEVIHDMIVPRPTTHYGISKLKAEVHAAGLTASGICAVSLRPPLIIGADASGNWARLQKLVAAGFPLPFGSIRNQRSIVSIDTMTQAISHLCRTRPSVGKSGSYGFADPDAVSLSCIVKELRAGFRMSARLFPFPKVALATLGRLAGRKRLMASLIDDLVVDTSRFYSTFDFRSQLAAREAIRKSAADYRILRSQIPESV